MMTPLLSLRRYPFRWSLIIVVVAVLGESFCTNLTMSGSKPTSWHPCLATIPSWRMPTGSSVIFPSRTGWLSIARSGRFPG